MTTTLRFTQGGNAVVHQLVDDAGRHFELHERLEGAASTFALFIVQGFTRFPVTINRSHVFGAGMKVDEVIAYIASHFDSNLISSARTTCDIVREYQRLHGEFMHGKKTLNYRGSFFFVRPDGKFDFSNVGPLFTIEEVMAEIDKGMGPC